MDQATVELTRLKVRTDFLAAAKAYRWAERGVVVQCNKRPDGDEPAGNHVRVGFTATKKIGNAVFRNRVKRRLRELAREILSQLARPGHDYVLIARSDTVDRDFDKMRDDLTKALAKVHGQLDSGKPPKPQFERKKGPKKTTPKKVVS
jgi:ribonuclease P protein component